MTGKPPKTNYGKIHVMLTGEGGHGKEKTFQRYFNEPFDRSIIDPAFLFEDSKVGNVKCEYIFSINIKKNIINQVHVHLLICNRFIVVHVQCSGDDFHESTVHYAYYVKVYPHCSE